MRPCVQVNAAASRVEAAVQGLALDELELASLRGEVQEAALSLNLEQRLGRGAVSIARPRFSGLQGQSLGGAFRWERDVVRLERAVLQQANSRCAVLRALTSPPPLLPELGMAAEPPSPPA
jgi:hypothetical protein